MRKAYYCRSCNSKAIELEDFEKRCEKCNSKDVNSYETFDGTRYRCLNCGHDSKTVKHEPFYEIACPLCFIRIREYFKEGKIVSPRGVFFYKTDGCKESTLRNEIYENVVERYFQPDTEKKPEEKESAIRKNAKNKLHP